MTHCLLSLSVNVDGKNGFQSRLKEQRCKETISPMNVYENLKHIYRYYCRKNDYLSKCKSDNKSEKNTNKKNATLRSIYRIICSVNNYNCSNNLQ